ncbi:glycosyltransferase [Nibricoccus aquaticus]|uniref:Glycosyltransferase n=1 Tax=Nibricoccus aquaticus TaxID=2576891 RepID=A0A290QHA4_9BACT|nr:glycosyltransferase family 2 protein [Nibricoccus aquaticus]ATC64728.1 glycosyltransferase [Nibricoccus aquaticus]
MSSNPAIKISIVSPVYRAEKLLDLLISRLTKVLGEIGITYEIILVEDCSPDASWNAVARLCAQNSHVVGLRLSRNFGQHYAISAGLNISRGEWVIVMDCDLQDQPEEIPNLLNKALEGHDIVLARRSVRQDNLLKRATSRLFYRGLSYLTGSKLDPAVANFGIYHRKVVAAINAMPESIRYFPTMVRWVGFRSTSIDVVHAARPEGPSSYNWSKLFNLACDIALAYSDKPLKLAVKTGVIISATGFVFAGYTIVQALREKITVLGYSSLIVSVWVLAGLIILINGIVGLYVGKIFEGVKRRPSFIVSEILPSGH